MIAAWGLIQEDLQNLIGRKTADEHEYYACRRGFNVGRPYELFLIHNTVVGVREDPQGAFHKGRAVAPWQPPPLKRPDVEPPEDTVLAWWGPIWQHLPEVQSLGWTSSREPGSAPRR